MAKIGLHWASTTNWMRHVDMPAPYVKVVNPPIDDIFPGKMTIGRVFMTDGEEGSYYARGKHGGADYFMRCLGWYRQSPHIHCWESFNEPAMIKTPAERRALDEATAEWTRLMHERGWRTCVGNFSERNPADGVIREFERMLETTDYLGLHMYAAPSLLSGFNVLRYRQLAAEVRDTIPRLPPILIGECGIDGGVIGKGRKGWQKFASWETYLSELKWYENQLAMDNYVAGAFLYTAGATKDWKTFDVNEKQAAQLAAWQRTFAPQPVTPVEPKPVTLPEQEQGDLRTLIQKARWWSEEITRAMAGDDYRRALILEISLTKLLRRIEGMV